MVVHPYHVQVRFEYQGHWVKVTVICGKYKFCNLNIILTWLCLSKLLMRSSYYTRSRSLQGQGHLKSSTQDGKQAKFIVNVHFRCKCYYHWLEKFQIKQSCVLNTCTVISTSIIQGTCDLSVSRWQWEQTTQLEDRNEIASNCHFDSNGTNKRCIGITRRQKI